MAKLCCLGSTQVLLISTKKPCTAFMQKNSMLMKGSMTSRKPSHAFRCGTSECRSSPILVKSARAHSDAQATAHDVSFLQIARQCCLRWASSGCPSESSREFIHFGPSTAPGSPPRVVVICKDIVACMSVKPQTLTTVFCHRLPMPVVMKKQLLNAKAVWNQRGQSLVKATPSAQSQRNPFQAFSEAFSA